jgi:predicted NodU family carbamoyl transferase
VVQGRDGFGLRALGARSIIGELRNTKMQSVMNLKIQYRESFVRDIKAISVNPDAFPTDAAPF